MDKQISTPWAVTAVVILLLVLGVAVWRYMTPPPPLALDPNGHTLGHAGYAPATPLPRGQQ